MDEDEIRLFLTDVILQIKEQIGRTYPECMEYFDGNSQLIEQIKTRFYLYEIVKYIDSMCTRAIQNIRSKSGAESAIEDVVSYIDHNYAQSLTLEEVAPLFGYNSVYFGKLFSKEMNISFNSYLNEKRMIEAKKLLRDSELKVYEIAARVGYNDVDYFSKKFKNSEGKSPADYRRSSRIGGQK
jgi:two-component system response regulator YesN